MQTDAKKIIISVTNDLVGDQRVHKVASSLIKNGYDVLLIGRLLIKSFPIERPYKTKRMRLLFRKSVLFYAEYNFRLFIFLLLHKADIFLSNDLDTLPANYYASKIKRKQLVYDSHEYFTEVPELVHRPKIKKIWERIERRILPKVKHSYTVCQSIADAYNESYSIDMKVVRNVPLCENKSEISELPFRKQFPGKKIIVYQGSVNIGRGLEDMIEAMKFIENTVFVIIGDGDIKADLERKVKEADLNKKVYFTGKIPLEKLKSYTASANIGISLEKNLGLNYYYALPNKLFDYIHAGIPVLASKLPEIERIIDTYAIGMFIDNHHPEHIAEKLNFMLNNSEDYDLWKKNCRKASEELCWENEEQILMSVLKSK
jgi:glycosyltransferase involved in cell wall biosynthesis